MTCVGIETKLFDTLCSSNSTVTNAELAQATGVDPVLMSTSESIQLRAYFD